MQQGVSDSAADGERARIALSRRGRRFDGGPDYPALHRHGLVRVANVDQFAIPVGPHAGEYQPAGPAIHPAAGLMPPSEYDAARCQPFNSYFCSTVHIEHAHRIHGTRWTDDPEAIAAIQRKVPLTMFESLQLIEEALAAGPWMLGATYSVCDPYLFRVATWAEGDGVDLARLPRILDHRRRMVERPGVRRAFAEGAA